MSIAKFSVGKTGAAGANASYITRTSACKEIKFVNLKELETETLRERRVNAMAYAATTEAVELSANPKGRTHYRLINSFVGKTDNEKAIELTEKMLAQTFPQARAIIAVHQDTNDTHAHVWIDARLTDNKKINLKNKDYKKISQTWTKICDEEFGTDYTVEYEAKRLETIEWKRAYALAKRTGAELPPKPVRAEDKMKKEEWREKDLRDKGIVAARGERTATRDQPQVNATDQKIKKRGEKTVTPESKTMINEGVISPLVNEVIASETSEKKIFVSSTKLLVRGKQIIARGEESGGRGEAEIISAQTTEAISDSEERKIPETQKTVVSENQRTTISTPAKAAMRSEERSVTPGKEQPIRENQERLITQGEKAAGHKGVTNGDEQIVAYGGIMTRFEPITSADEEGILEGESEIEILINSGSEGAMINGDDQASTRRNQRSLERENRRARRSERIAGRAKPIAGKPESTIGEAEQIEGERDWGIRAFQRNVESTKLFVAATERTITILYAGTQRAESGAQKTERIVEGREQVQGNGTGGVELGDREIIRPDSRFANGERAINRTEQTALGAESDVRAEGARSEDTGTQSRANSGESIEEARGNRFGFDEDEGEYLPGAAIRDVHSLFPRSITGEINRENDFEGEFHECRFQDDQGINESSWERLSNKFERARRGGITEIEIFKLPQLELSNPQIAPNNRAFTVEIIEMMQVSLEEQNKQISLRATKIYEEQLMQSANQAPNREQINYYNQYNANKAADEQISTENKSRLEVTHEIISTMDDDHRDKLFAAKSIQLEKAVEVEKEEFLREQMEFYGEDLSMGM